MGRRRLRLALRFALALALRLGFDLRLRLGLRFRLRLALDRPNSTPRPSRSLLPTDAPSLRPASDLAGARVVGDVPARSLELNRRRREQLADGAVALAGRRRRAGRSISESLRTDARTLRTRIRTEASALYSSTASAGRAAQTIGSSSECSVAARRASVAAAPRTGAAPCAISASWNARSDGLPPCCSCQSRRSLSSASLPAV